MGLQGWRGCCGVLLRDGSARRHHGNSEQRRCRPQHPSLLGIPVKGRGREARAWREAIEYTHQPFEEWSVKMASGTLRLPFYQRRILCCTGTLHVMYARFIFTIGCYPESAADPSPQHQHRVCPERAPACLNTLPWAGEVK